MVQVNSIVQACWVVRDLHEAMARFQRTMGCGPFFWIADVSPENGRYRGTPVTMVSDIALAQAGAMQIELVQPKSPAPSVYRDVVPEGEDGFHHLCYFSDDFDGERVRYEGLGVETAFDGVSNGDMRIAYYDTRHLNGCMSEVLETNKGVQELFAMVADAARDWDGSDPIRRLAV